LVITGAVRICGLGSDDFGPGLAGAGVGRDAREGAAAAVFTRYSTGALRLCAAVCGLPAQAASTIAEAAASIALRKRVDMARYSCGCLSIWTAGVSLTGR
jgi:hypothetical protein